MRGGAAQGGHHSWGRHAGASLLSGRRRHPAPPASTLPAGDVAPAALVPRLNLQQAQVEQGRQEGGQGRSVVHVQARLRHIFNRSPDFAVGVQAQAAQAGAGRERRGVQADKLLEGVDGERKGLQACPTGCMFACAR